MIGHLQSHQAKFEEAQALLQQMMQTPGADPDIQQELSNLLALLPPHVDKTTGLLQEMMAMMQMQQGQPGGGGGGGAQPPGPGPEGPGPQGVASMTGTQPPNTQEMGNQIARQAAGVE